MAKYIKLKNKKFKDHLTVRFNNLIATTHIGADYGCAHCGST